MRSPHQDNSNFQSFPLGSTSQPEGADFHDAPRLIVPAELAPRKRADA
jgi:hypothetical protein